MHINTKKLYKYALYYSNNAEDMNFVDHDKGEKVSYTFFPKITVYKLYSNRFNKWVMAHAATNEHLKRNGYFFLVSRKDNNWIYYNFETKLWEKTIVIKVNTNPTFEKSLFDLIEFINPDLDKIPDYSYHKNHWK